MLLTFKHTRRIAALVALTLVAGVPGLAAQDKKVYKAGDPGVVAPAVKRNTQPVYSDGAQSRGITGEVTIAFEIDRDGRTRDVKVVTGLDPELDKNAVAAVSDWLFEPATNDGQPVIRWAKTKIRFNLQ